MPITNPPGAPRLGPQNNGGAIPEITLTASAVPDNQNNPPSRTASFFARRPARVADEPTAAIAETSAVASEVAAAGGGVAADDGAAVTRTPGSCS